MRQQPYFVVRLANAVVTSMLYFASTFGSRFQSAGAGLFEFMWSLRFIKDVGLEIRASRLLGFLRSVLSLYGREFECLNPVIAPEGM